MFKALIIGASGQDGTLLSRYLQKNNVEVIGSYRQTKSGSQTGAALLDITDRFSIDHFFSHHHIDYIYYLAAHHHSSQSTTVQRGSEFAACLETHVVGLMHVLEAVLQYCSQARLFYAASSLVFGETQEGVANEQSLRVPACAYGITKNMGIDVVAWYRERHGLFACSGILFNHESHLRSPDFVSKKVVRTAVAIKQGRAKELVVGSLAAATDWGFAPDYVRAFEKMLQSTAPKDYVIATGELHTVQDWIENSFSLLGLNWRDHVWEDATLMRRKKVPLRGDISAIRNELGWMPSTTFEQMVMEMMQKEMKYAGSSLDF
ncbi:NAD-dependent epimerase/dehydratase [Solidesulfovibrio fructosivorans JJ]]|uniref:GDP-mannose 4,6-dehydratase n=1 Tax=Solidesulfovibrio fructosivorans JJ] TaxID=596151 RepID=E1JXM6_SOLFR|nr:GDP-mannose 4,6-dehydratase [Solidesulfovibrio fructosivorans]EFL50799.1 NAD-dependent epimerase/dehydratase [Solidesulfovibrio fructosivorans JJ]]